MAHIPLIEQFKVSIQTKRPSRTPSRRSTRSPFKPNFARRLPFDSSYLSTIETLSMPCKQPSLDLQAVQFRGNSASPVKRRTRSSRDPEKNMQQGSKKGLEIGGEMGKVPLAQKIVLPRLPLLPCDPHPSFLTCLGGSSRNRGRFTYEKEVDCVTNKQTEGSTRIYWKRRGEMKGKPLLIINFEGIIGDIVRVEESQRLIVRAGLVAGSGLLSERFQIAVFVGLSRRRSRKLVGELLDLGMEMDAAYKRRGRGKRPVYVSDYTQPVSDFHSSCSTVLTVSPLLLDQDEVLNPSSPYLLYSPTLSMSRRYVLRGLPTTSTVTVLVPSLQAQENYLVPALDTIAGQLLRFTDLHPVPNFLHLYHCHLTSPTTSSLRSVPSPPVSLRADLLQDARILLFACDKAELKPCTEYPIVLD